MDKSDNGCLVIILAVLLKGLAVYALYWWVVVPIFGVHYDLTYWQAIVAGILIEMVF